jgi:hypothetical protein
MSDPYRGSASSSREREWLALQGKEPAHVDAWRQGIMPADLARRAAGPGDDVVAGIAIAILITGACLLFVALFVMRTWAWIAGGAVLALGGAVAVFVRSTNPAKRLGYGRVMRVASRGTLATIERTDDDVTRRFDVIRWRLPSGTEIESVLPSAIVDEVRANEGATFDLYFVEKQGKPVLLAVLPPGAS